MIKTVANVVEKMRVPIIIINLLTIGAAFYKQGHMDALKEITAETTN